MGSVRYGMRMGSVSPPPPGAGPCYRTQCCWPNVPGGIPGHVSWISPLATPSINSFDIISCANRVKMSETATSELSQQATVRDQILFANKFFFKGRLRRCALVRPQVYDRLCNFGDDAYEEDDILNNLDRLPRFRFGGNRTNAANKAREFEKTSNEQRLKDLTDRLKRGPVPPPRTKRITPPSKPSQLTKIEDNIYARLTPLRSASFSQVDYLSDGKKYVRKDQGIRNPLASEANNVHNRGVATLPRSKNFYHCRLRNGEKPDPKCSHSYSRTLTPKEESDTDNDIHIPGSNSMTNETKSDKNEDQCLSSSGISRTSNASTNTSDDKKFKSKRRKGVYISQWPAFTQTSDHIIPQFVEDGDFEYLEISPSISKDPLQEIPKIQASEDKSSDFSVWSSPQEEPLSPDENISPPEWPNRYKLSTPFLHDRSNSVESHSIGSVHRLDSFSEDEPDLERKSDQISFVHSDSDVRQNVPRRYTKRPLRGPYGQMLEAEMKKPEAGIKNQINYDLNFLNDIPPTAARSSSMKLGKEMQPKYTKRDASSRSYDDNQLKNCYNHLLVDPHRTQLPKRKVSADSFAAEDGQQFVNHQRTTSSPSKLESFINTEVSNVLLEQLLQGSSEQLAIQDNRSQQLLNDTRTHVVVELYDNERSYVESLQILMTKYLEPLKSPENATLLDWTLVDEVFNEIPFLLSHHQYFLEELRKRLDQWDMKQKIGDIFLEMFSKSILIDIYTNYVNNWKRARDIIKTTQQTKPPFAKFLENTAREHKGKLALDSLLIKPIQKFPKYELLIQRLIKHTDANHPDHNLLLLAQRELHEQILKINCTERETLELEQLREIEGLIEGLMDLVSLDRQYVRHDLVSMTAGAGTRKERGFFLFSDLLLVTSIKRRSGTIRKPTSTADKGSVTSALEANKYKLLMKIALEDLEIVKSKDENVRQMMIEMDNLTEDLSVLNQMNDLSTNLHCNHNHLDEIIKEMLISLNKQLTEQQTSDSQLSYLDLNLNTSNGIENISILFSNPEKRASWEDSFNEAKNKLLITGTKKNCPELLATVPIRKTRAGLQFTCAAPTLGDNGKDVWVCNSDGYVGQVCVLSFQPEPTVTSCNGVCNARILCIASIPATTSGITLPSNRAYTREENKEPKIIQFDSSSSSDEDDKSDYEGTDEINVQLFDSGDTSSLDLDESDTLHSTMWLGTEDGCIHVYNSSDNIRIKKNKIRIQLNSSVLNIVYLENRVFVSLANGDIVIYDRDGVGGWNITSPITITIGSTATPVLKMISNGGKLWCSCGNTVKVLNTQSLITENSFTVHNDNNKPINCIVVSGSNVWISLLNAAIVKCFNAATFEFICEINVASAVTKMLTSCDDIIRQHKAACLRVTSLLACKDLLWVGTSAGVLLTMPLPHVSTSSTNLSTLLTVTGVSHGHTGHVRFLTYIEISCGNTEVPQHRNAYKRITDQRNTTKLLVISGGDGYEDFRASNLSEVAGREDSTNHLLLWSV